MKGLYFISHGHVYEVISEVLAVGDIATVIVRSEGSAPDGSQGVASQPVAAIPRVYLSVEQAKAAAGV
tara:strand:+ start:4131 stop:4334 length:204 start_codon:yes stop_codon:yes gene_type:complete